MSYGTELVVVMPGLAGHPRLAWLRERKDVNGRDTSAFTRVFDALCPAMTEQVALP
jgi:hypothetical protein